MTYRAAELGAPARGLEKAAKMRGIHTHTGIGKKAGRELLSREAARLATEEVARATEQDRYLHLRPR